MRLLIAAAAGGLFGLGLMVSGMTQTGKVQGWLDIFGDWDPTLAFVMGGAILPMALAWRVTARRSAPLAGGTFPAPPSTRLGPDLILGSMLFGVGWGLTGLCPGPSLASLSWGGWGGALFLFAMIMGMLASPAIGRRLAPA